LGQTFKAVVALIDSAIWFKDQYGPYAEECAESYYHLPSLKWLALNVN
jgi:uncharacterized protein YwgA